MLNGLCPVPTAGPSLCCGDVQDCSQLIWWLSSCPQPAGSASALALATTSVAVSLLSQLPPFWHHVLLSATLCGPSAFCCSFQQICDPEGQRLSSSREDECGCTRRERKRTKILHKDLLRRNYMKICEDSTCNWIFSNWLVLQKNIYSLQCFISARLKRWNIPEGLWFNPCQELSTTELLTECPSCPGREENQ